MKLKNYVKDGQKSNVQRMVDRSVRNTPHVAQCLDADPAGNRLVDHDHCTYQHRGEVADRPVRQRIRRIQKKS